MKSYYFIKDGSQQGPFSLSELKNQDITRDTKVWFYGLEDWTKLSAIEELEELAWQPAREYDATNGRGIGFFLLILVAGTVIFISFLGEPDDKQNKDKTAPQTSSANAIYDVEEDFEMYLSKFYRDARYLGIYPPQAETTIIKFAKLDQQESTAHIHGVAMGMNDDNRIEIYINPSAWANFNKPMRYVVMYHELAHDILNLEHQQSDDQNTEKLLMYPDLADYRSFTMDQFIESYQTAFASHALTK